MADGKIELQKVRDYLTKMVQDRGSDLHIKSSAVFRARIQGNITALGD